MIHLTPIRLTDDQMAAIHAAASGLDSGLEAASFTVTDADDLEAVLALAQATLARRSAGDPLACPELDAMHLCDTAPGNHGTVLLCVGVEDLTLATHLHLNSIVANSEPLAGPLAGPIYGPAALAAVLDLLISERNQLVRRLLRLATKLGLASYAHYLGLDAEDLDEDVHDIASLEGSDVNNGGLETQLDYLARNLGPSTARARVEEIASQQPATPATPAPAHPASAAGTPPATGSAVGAQSTTSPNGDLV